MIDYKVLNENIIEKLFESMDKFIFIIDKSSKILDYNKNFSEYFNTFKYLEELITYTHRNEFIENIKKLNTENSTIKFVSNFSFDKSNVEDIPSTFEIVFYLNKDETITVVAEAKHPLSQDDAKIYLSMINDFSETSRKLTKTKLKLKKLNNNLQEEINNAVDELRQKDKILLKQAKDAAMGEMIDSVAHQWKSPLGVIKLLSEAIRMEYEFFDEPDSSQIIKDTLKIDNQVKHMIETLEEFRGFFRPNANTKKVSLLSLIESVNHLMKDELIKNCINIEIKSNKDLEVEIVPNQFKHVLINLISNSKDAFNENSIKNRVISYKIEQKDKTAILKVFDNAGGIEENIINNIFEANFTTKSKTKGTGIGLYMTKMIVNKAKGDIKALNCKNGSCFEISLPLNHTKTI
ncbi:MAG: sensor histidine kinase [Campylobacterota bacterium]